MDRLDMCVEVLQDSRKPMHIREIATEVLKKYPQIEGGDNFDEFAAKIGNSLSNHIRSKGKKAEVRRVKKGGVVKKGYFQAKSKGIKRSNPAPVPCVSTGYTGKAGEYGLISELLFRGFNASIMPVDTGIDVVASKDGKYFHIQVKTSNVNKNKKYQFSISRDSFKANVSSSTFYVLIMRRYINQLWRSDYFVLPNNDIERFVAVGVVTDSSTYTLVIDPSNNRFLLNNGKEDLSFFLNNFDILH